MNIKKCFLKSVVVLCATFSTLYTVPVKPWTFLVYMAAANDLNDFVDQDMAEMMKIGSNNNVNIVVYQTLQRNYMPKETKFFYVNKGSVTEVVQIAPQDSGDVHTLMQALQLTITLFPSDHIVVVLWDHGSGPLNRSFASAIKGICYDYETNNYLTDRDCHDAFSWAQTNLRNGKKFDIIACDACLMAGLEMAYTFAGCADYFVASQETIPGDGYQYSRVLDDFLVGTPTPRNFAINMISAYQDTYARIEDVTLSAIDLSLINTCVRNANAMAQLLTNALKSKQKVTVKKYINKAVQSSLRFDDGIYVDLGNVCSYLSQYVSKMGLSTADAQSLTAAIQAVNTALTKCVIAKSASLSYKAATGLSIYFAGSYIDSSYYNLYWTQNNPVWLSLFQQYKGQDLLTYV